MLGLQEGIYHAPKDFPRNSFAVVFLRAIEPADTLKLRQTLANLWNMYKSLKKELVIDLNIDGRDGYRRTLTVLIGYGPRFFEMNGMIRTKPKYLNKEWLFLPPGITVSPVLPETGLKYAEGVTSNEVADDHIIIQFIGDTQLATHRAIVETWKFLKRTEDDNSSVLMTMRTFYTGFNRPDGRGWLGFHDGISNVKSADRLKTILTNKRNLDPVDYWTCGGGTYMAFLRIGIDLNIWENVSVKEQERIVGREKSSGCLLIGPDRQGNNTFVPGCPAGGTRQLTEKGNERFRQYHKSSRQPVLSGASSSGSDNSHVGRMLKVPERIFRQGYEFIESTQGNPYFRVGLNFVSFQGGTDQIYRGIKYGFRRVNFGGDPSSPIPGAGNLLSVYAAGLFFVPPFDRQDNFPGEIIFKKQKIISPYGARFPARKMN